MELKYSQKAFKVKGIEVFVQKNNVKVGNALLYILDNPNRGKKYGLLADVRVEPDFRGKGVGTELIKKVICTAQEEGCYKLLADSRFTRENVHTWYEKHGFKKHGFGFRLNYEEVEAQL